MRLLALIVTAVSMAVSLTVAITIFEEAKRKKMFWKKLEKSLGDGQK